MKNLQHRPPHCLRQPRSLALLLCLSLNACGGGGGPSSNGQSLPPANGLAPPCLEGCDFALDGSLSGKDSTLPPPLSPGQSQSDNAFSTLVTRAQAPQGTTRIRHSYAKGDVFNRDSSMAILQDEQGRSWLYDTRDWRVIKRLAVRSSQAEIQWHADDRERFYFLDFAPGSSDLRRLSEYDVSNDRVRVLKYFDRYTRVSTRSEGNMDAERRWMALIGELPNGTREALVYELSSDTVLGRTPLPEGFYDWISMSPKGEFVVLMGRRHSEIYSRDLTLKHRLPDGSFGHGDLCLGFDQRELMVFDGADLGTGSKRDIAVAFLDTGEIARVGQIGWAATPHVSCRNLDLPGWALISTQTTNPKYTHFTALNDEVFWLRLDGSGTIRRVARHHSSNAGYFTEPHATSDRQGLRVLFASDWQGQSSISSYWVDLRQLRQ